MINYILYTIILIVIILFILNIYIYKYYKNIIFLEGKISILFNKRLGLIPGFFEISKKNIVKHAEVFHELLKIFKLDSTIYDMDMNFYKRRYIISILDHEINFLFKIFNKNLKLNNNYKYLYIKNITIDNNIEISNFIYKYDKFIKKYNILLKINYLFIIGYFIPSNLENMG